jgi:hypothetical protein
MTIGTKTGYWLDVLEQIKTERKLEIRILFWRNHNFTLGLFKYLIDFKKVTTHLQRERERLGTLEGQKIFDFDALGRFK